MRRALVTGATGFLGRALTSRLVADGVKTWALLRRSSVQRMLSRGAIGVRSDLSSASLRRLVARIKPDAVFHLAGAAKGTDAELEEANFAFGVRLAEACAPFKTHELAPERVRASFAAPVFIAAGTYWQRRESPRPDPMDEYAAWKQKQEDALARLAKEKGLRAATVVLYDVYGPGDRRGKILSLLADASRAKRGIDLSPGRQKLELVYVDDAVEAFVKAARLLASKPAVSGSTWYVTSSRAVTLKAAAAALAKVVGPIPANWGGRSYRPRETMRPWRGRRVPGWRPKTSLPSGLKKSFGADA